MRNCKTFLSDTRTVLGFCYWIFKLKDIEYMGGDISDTNRGVGVLGGGKI
jgi:hypothetical protein